ncbi:hypothetical protein [Kineosporia sp. R_H_3]|uniref:hypothetical protein n=1 Tax=Kineosporia sp. R_H_3 TaxID=1961848 RepID=UPI0013043A67|nr:hypothetical protein [Kineosporia sp. R_H_3]
MSVLEMLAQLVMGGPPKVQCDGCGVTVSGDDLGAVAPQADKSWCRGCLAAGRVPDEV